MNPAARKQLVSEILTNAAIDSQEELVRVLKKRGVEVTQTTASRDLLELGALRGKIPLEGFATSLVGLFRRPIIALATFCSAQLQVETSS